MCHRTACCSADAVAGGATGAGDGQQVASICHDKGLLETRPAALSRATPNADSDCDHVQPKGRLSQNQTDPRAETLAFVAAVPETAICRTLPCF